MQKLGRDISKAEVDEMIQTHDKTGDGCLSFVEFKSIFFTENELAEYGEP